MTLGYNTLVKQEVYVTVFKLWCETVMWVFRDNKMTAYLSHAVYWEAGGLGLEEIMCQSIPQTTEPLLWALISQILDLIIDFVTTFKFHIYF